MVEGRGAAQDVETPRSRPGAAICIDCRTVLPRDTPCDAPGHRVTLLTNHAGRERLRTEVWGPPTVRRRVKQLARAGGSSAGAGVIFEACAHAGEGCGLAAGETGGLLAAIAAILAFVLAGVALAWGAFKLVELIRRRRHRERPNGAVSAPASLGPRTNQVGRIVKAGTLRAPAGGPAAGYALRLACRRFARSETMLVDARVAALQIELDDGRLVRVPAGRVRLPVARRRADPDATLGAALRELDALAEPGEDHAAVPWDRAFVEVLREGQRVEVASRLEPASGGRSGEGEGGEGGEGGGPYRAQSTPTYQCAGVPALRPLDGQA